MDEAHGQAPPVEADHDFGVEVHEEAHATPFHHGERVGDGIDAVAAHAVDDLEAERFNPDPDVRDVAADQALLRNGLVVFGTRRPEDAGVPAGGLDECGGIRQIVLAVGVDLKRMRIALGGRMFEPRQKRPALASVDLVAQKRHLGMQDGKPVKLARTLGITCVVDDDDGKLQGRKALKHAPEGEPVVAARNDDDGTEV